MDLLALAARGLAPVGVGAPLIGLIIPAAAFAITRVAGRDCGQAVVDTVMVFVVLLATGFRSDAGWFVILTLLALWLYGVRLPPWASPSRPSRSCGRQGERSLPGGIVMNLVGVLTTNEALVIDAIDHRIGNLYGLTYVWNFHPLLPGSQPDMTTWIKDHLGVRFEGSGITPTLAGDAYFNFGWLCVPVVGALIGSALAVLGRVQTTAPTHALVLAVATAAIVHAIPGGLGSPIVASLRQVGLALLVAVPFGQSHADPERPSENGAAAP